MMRLALTLSLLAGLAVAEEAASPDVADSRIAVTDPYGGVAGPFDAVPQTREVFFGFDGESLTEVGLTKMAVLAEAARRSGAGSAMVVGHADTVGDAAYNRALSQRRAEAVRRELLSRGVPREAITLSSVGLADPAVPTGPGVRERANRRVVVTIDGAGAFQPFDPDQPIRFPLP